MRPAPEKKWPGRAVHAEFTPHARTYSCSCYYVVHLQGRYQGARARGIVGSWDHPAQRASIAHAHEPASQVPHSSAEAASCRHNRVLIGVFRPTSHPAPTQR